MIIEGTWKIDELAAEIGPQRLAIDKWPTTDFGALSGYVIPEMVYVNANASDNRLATSLLFAEHIISESAQSLIADSGRIPAHRDVVITDIETGPLISQAMSALEGGTGYPVLPEFALYQQPLDDMLRSVFSSISQPQAALSAAQEEIIQLLSSPAVSPTPTP